MVTEFTFLYPGALTPAQFVIPYLQLLTLCWTFNTHARVGIPVEAVLPQFLIFWADTLHGTITSASVIWRNDSAV